MTSKAAATLCVLAVALAGVAAPASAAQPRLSVVSGVEGTFLESDGVSEVALGSLMNLGERVLVTNTVSGARRWITQAPCGEEAPSAGSVGRVLSLRPVTVADGMFLQECEGRGGTKAMTFTSIADGSTRRVPFPEQLVADAFGSVWVHLAESGYKQYRDAFFAPSTGVLRSGETSATTYDDLNSTALVLSLCRPVRRPVVNEELARLAGVSAAWVVIQRNNLLLAWHCGRPRPVVLSSLDADQNDASFSAGIVTWIERGGFVDAMRLSTGRRWRWRSRWGFARVVHTGNELFAVENCPLACLARQRENPILSAPLARL